MCLTAAIPQLCFCLGRFLPAATICNLAPAIPIIAADSSRSTTRCQRLCGSPKSPLSAADLLVFLAALFSGAVASNSSHICLKGSKARRIFIAHYPLSFVLQMLRIYHCVLLLLYVFHNVFLISQVLRLDLL